MILQKLKNEFWVYKKLWKKIMLGTSDDWSMNCLSHRPSDPAYHIEDCPILSFFQNPSLCSREFSVLPSSQSCFRVFASCARAHTDQRRQHHMIYESKKTQFHKLLFIRIMIQKRWWWCGWCWGWSLKLSISSNSVQHFGTYHNMYY